MYASWPARIAAAAFVWLIPVVASWLLIGPASALLSGGVVPFAIGSLIAISLLSLARAAFGLSIEILTGRYVREQRASGEGG
ncbi:MAG: hypothetical protein HY553_10105 [Elusimicrobia bacterium]|nr:hypothetical protein [Elusimicrobiota bacterium]